MTDDRRGGQIPIERMGEVPSYRYKLEEAKRRRWGASGSHGVRDPVMEINDKFLAYEFADRHGVDHPKIYEAYQSIHDVKWDDLPDAFVLKSRSGSTNRGVKALVKEAPGMYRDLLRSRIWTVDLMVEHQRDLEASQAASRSMFSEELVWKTGIPGAIADDWKFYCFYGKSALVMQRDLKKSGNHDDWRFKFWDSEWNDLGPVKFGDRWDVGLPGPRDGHALKSLAERLSEIIGRPFIRIDLFESDRGPLLGEFTPTPGPPEVFSPEIDEMLGAFWEEAEMRIFAEETERGRWDHLRVEEPQGDDQVS